jgi:hypothetical protein
METPPEFILTRLRRLAHVKLQRQELLPFCESWRKSTKLSCSMTQ